MPRLLEHFELVDLVRRLSAQNELNTEETQAALQRDALDEIVERIRYLQHGTNNPRCTCCTAENVLAIIGRRMSLLQLPD